jgi:hypothetical protein
MNKYMPNNWTMLLDDIQKQLEQNLSANFFLNWKHTVSIAENSTISKLYELCDNYSVEDNRIQHILYEMALNHIGIHEASNEILAREAYKAVDEILYSELFVQQKEEVIAPFTIITDKRQNENSIDIYRLYAHLNACIFIDETNIDQNIVLSGNIYEIIDKRSPLILNEKDCFDSTYPDSFRYIAIEMTPPCDAMNKRIGYRLVGGILFKTFDQNGVPCTCKNPGDKQYNLRLVQFDNEIYSIVFDFRYLHNPIETELKNAGKYKLIAKCKPKLFADILQKFSSHASRLGIPAFEISMSKKNKKRH